MPSMAAWETEDEVDATGVTALPTPPAEPPYRTPSRSSRRSRRSNTPPRSSASPPPLPGTDRTDKTDKSDRSSSKRSSRDMATDETISILDPRRFTPTLHANLVSEILALRRDQEEKVKIIESLETALHTSREENEALAGTTKENRSLKRQLALIEGGTSSALGQLARERDDAVDSVGETKKRLETAQKKVRHQEEASDRLHEEWAREKEAWDEERRKLERKIHVSDSRLKAVLDEVAAFQEAQFNGLNGSGIESEGEEALVGKEVDAVSIRTMSITNSIRYSIMGAKPNGNSLADELNFDDFDDDTDNGGRDSVQSSPFHGRNQSRESVLSRTHQRNRSNGSPKRHGSLARGRFLNQAVLERLEGAIHESEEESTPEATRARKVEYTDSAVQYSPPPSPKLTPKTVPEPAPELAAAVIEQPAPPPIPTRADRSSIHSVHEATCEGSPRSEIGEIEANQRRKRVHIARPLTMEPMHVSSGHMVSIGSQSGSEEPLSPPKTPKSASSEKRASLNTPPVPSAPAMVSSETQTDTPPPPSPQQLPVLSPNGLVPFSHMPIPSISIHPPTSRPTTPREPLLPPLFKDFGCQVEISRPMVSTSVAVQTDEIRVDKRLDRLPAHLHPSAVTSRPSSPAATIVDAEAAGVDDLSRPQQFTPVPGHLPPRNPKRLANRSSAATNDSSSSVNVPVGRPAGRPEDMRDAYPGNNDNGPLSSQKAPMRRPHRISSLFAGFDAASSDEADEFFDAAEMSDNEYRTALSAPKPRSSGSLSRSGAKRGSGLRNGTTSPDQYASQQLRRGSVRTGKKPIGGYGGLEMNNRPAIHEVPRDNREVALARRLSHKNGPVMNGSGKSNIMRKAAMIQNGIASHQGRSSPSIPENRIPPFPIPTRASSRRPPLSASAPSDGQRSPTRHADPWHRRGNSRTHYRANSIRKVRSAAAIPVKPRYRRNGSRSPPPNGLYEEPESPYMPPLPSNDITMPPRVNYVSTSRYSRSPQRNYQTPAHAGTVEQSLMGSINGTSQASGVVDAIAQTMVGEWMYKYVRRRKSFGGPDNVSRDDSSNDRHKRWVWLAPYERAILWSSKQPSNNVMLMGKSGRKLTIQSVLDVKDDNPPPRGCSQLFNRSILILTPQRALKFTATTSERHFLWLTSLSFLAHSQQAVPENISIPPLHPNPDFDVRYKGRKRAGIRDSIRLTKSKAALVRTGPPHTSVIAELPPPPPPMSISSHTDSTPNSAPSYRPPESYTSAPSVAATSSSHMRDTSRDTAEPPVIPRFPDRAGQVLVHGRKRSNTGGHVPPPLSFRGFSGPMGSSSSYHNSTNSTAGNSDVSQSQASTNVTWGHVQGHLQGPMSQRTSEASSRPSGAVMNNFFDAIGTVRMEAFISPLSAPQFDDYPDEHDEMQYRARRRSKEMRRRASRSRHRDSYQSRGTRGTDDYYSRAGDEDYFREDPFKGF